MSDTIRFNEDSKNNLKIFFAPRGESTDGPIAFMHSATGVANPDAPLGHHVGQDVGHISSTVLGASLLLRKTRFEASGFNGTESQPDAVDLPMGPINSAAFRIIEEFSPEFTAMISMLMQEIQSPEFQMFIVIQLRSITKCSLEVVGVFKIHSFSDLCSIRWK